MPELHRVTTALHHTAQEDVQAAFELMPAILRGTRYRHERLRTIWPPQR